VCPIWSTRAFLSPPLAVVPEHEALGLQAANFLFDLSGDDWQVEHFPLEVALSVRTVVDVKLVRANLGLRPEALTHIDSAWSRARSRAARQSMLKLAGGPAVWHGVKTRLPTSLRSKLVRAMVGLLAAISTITLIVVGAMGYLNSRATLGTLEAHLRDSIAHQGRELVALQALALRDLVADNAFRDVARLVERTTQQNDDLVYGLFLDTERTPWAFVWRGGDPKKATPKWEELGIDTTQADTPGVRLTTKPLFGQTVFEFASPVIDDRGAVLGTLRYGVSDRSLKAALGAAQAASRRTLASGLALLLALGGAAMAVGVVSSRRAAARVTSPVTALTAAANAFGAGRRDVQVTISSGDELELLGAAFNHMAAELQVHTDRLKDVNRDLETKVAARTAEVAGRNRDMRLVLDNVDQGLVTLSASGQMANERSRIIDYWFGASTPGTRFTDYVGRRDPGFAELFQLGFEALLEGTLPRAMCIDQLPSRIRTDGRELACRYRVLGEGDNQSADRAYDGRDDGPVSGLLIMIDDVTAEVARAKREAERAEIMGVFEALMKDRNWFLSFVAESDRQISDLPAADLITQKRLIHTLKGNCHVVGLGMVAALCDAVEAEMADTNQAPSRAALGSIERRWSELKRTLQSFLGEKGREVIEVDAAEIDRLDEQVREGATAARVRERLASWKLEPAERPLARLATHARALAKRLGQGELDVVTDDGGVRLSADHWSTFWSVMVHVVRNAVDHGFEPPADRMRNGKPAQPRLRLAVAGVEGKIVVEAEDDGAGIDWLRVKQKAAAFGLAHDSEQDLTKAIFAPNLTTRNQATSVSGRGMGLAAVRTEVTLRGGSISVHSRPGGGTCLRFTLPVPDLSSHFSVAAVDSNLDSVAAARVA
jgi:two-component system chemotaxis sensor kinase CheA